MDIIITSPSLDPSINVSGISSVTQFIIDNNKGHSYLHFELGKHDKDSGSILCRIIANLKKLIKWIKLLYKNKRAIIHYNFPLSSFSILRDPLFIMIARIMHMGIIIHIHGGAILCSEQIPPLFYYILRKTFSDDIPLIVQSEYEKEILEHTYKCHTVYILPNCVNLSDANKYYKKKINLNSKLVMGYIGRIAETKGMDYLLAACISLKEKKIPYILKLAGQEEIENQYIPLFREHLGSDFIYEGVVSGDKKDIYYKSLDIFILPSFFEGLPMSLLESMSYGIVPITTKVGSIETVIKDGINGLYIEVKDSVSIEDKFLVLNANRDFLYAMSQVAHKTIIDHFNPNQYIAELNVIYEKLKKSYIRKI